MTKDTKNTILIIEDESVQRKPLVDELTDQGYKVLTALNGQEGLEQAQQAQPDLILLDILMPDLDGLSMLKKLRDKNSWGKQVPVILLTNLSGNSEEIVKAVDRDKPAYFLTKADCTLKDIVGKIKEILV